MNAIENELSIALQITVQARIDTREKDQRVAEALDAFSELMNRFERALFARLRSEQKWTGDLAVSLYKEFGISAKLAESGYYSLLGKLKSTVELAKLNYAKLTEKIDAKAKQIKDKTKRISTAKVKLDKALDRFVKVRENVSILKKRLDAAKSERHAKALQRYKSELGVLHTEGEKIGEIRKEINRLKFDLHQHKRRKETFETKRQKAFKKIKNPTICFGTRKLFKAQFSLKENGFASQVEWKEVWQNARTSTFIIEGLASSSSGNQFAKLHCRADGLFDLELRLPEAIKAFADEMIVIKGMEIYRLYIRGLNFPHRADELEQAIKGNVPVSIRFHQDNTSWRVMPGFKLELAETSEDYTCGAVGVDLNAGFASVARVNRHGNVVEAFDIPMETYGKSEGQTDAVVELVAAQITAYAVRYDLPVVSEKLDFRDKKVKLKEQHKPRYARMLSSFTYSAFDTALASACARSGVYYARVNPAYTSIIGRTKFAARYGLTVHAAAALAIARRAMKLSERLPLSFSDRVITLPKNDAHHVTLELPDRKDNGQLQTDRPRHVWSDWNEVNRAFRKAVVPRRPSRRKTPRSTLGRNDLHSMVCRRRKDVLEASSQSQDQRVGPDAVSG
jgi:IS605 OrfB family transposase